MQLTHGGTIPGSRPSFSPQYRYVPALRQLKQGGLFAPGEALSQRQTEEAPSRPSSSLSGSDHVSWHAPGSALSSPLLSLISFIPLETWIIWSSSPRGLQLSHQGTTTSSHAQSPLFRLHIRSLLTFCNLSRLAHFPSLSPYHSLLNSVGYSYHHCTALLNPPLPLPPNHSTDRPASTITFPPRRSFPWRETNQFRALIG